MSGFEVLHGGILTSVQDKGRDGHTHCGITPSGAMDEYAYLWSQKLLDNHGGNALEILLSGLKLKATAPTTISVCGADLGFHINGSPLPIWQTHQVYPGDILTFEHKKKGMRAYLAVKGGFEVPVFEGSCATTLKENKGKKLEKGDILPFSPSTSREIRRVADKFLPRYPDTLTLRIILSAQHHYFTEKQQEEFFTHRYTITPQISRMGYKLQGEAMVPSTGGIISEGITFGAIQIPPDGQPIILLKERQTIGGYPKIGSLLPIDCFRLAQLPIGAKVTFEPIKIEEAQKEMRAFYRFFS
ncbi:MAG: biotin-dependent carboxyltransferase family protein [Sulfurimonas sp.]